MNYPFTNSVLDYTVNGKLDGLGFANEIGKLLAAYSQTVTEAAFNLLGSHDTPRLLTLCDGDERKMKLAVTLLLTYPGVPCIYYGDEVGLDGDMIRVAASVWNGMRPSRTVNFWNSSPIRLPFANSTLRCAARN